MTDFVSVIPATGAGARQRVVRCRTLCNPPVGRIAQGDAPSLRVLPKHGVVVLEDLCAFGILF